jgi:hypothetical protein
MYGAYEGEVLAPKGKLRVIPYICSGTALIPIWEQVMKIIT